MNRYEKEVQQSLLDSEEAAMKELEAQYARALKDINEKVKGFQADIDLLDEALSQDGLDDATRALLQSQKRSKVYQQQYQKALQGQVSGILDKMHGDNYATIDKYLKDCYEDGYIGTMYDISRQGVPVIAPIDQSAAVKAILTDSKVSNGLYNALGVDVAKLKKTITQEISRGIASGLPYRDIARNIGNVSGAPLSRAKTIARTEGHRIQQTSSRDAQYAAKAKGADVVKQWDAALDGRTRDSHRRVDGEIRELDEKFSNGLMFPGDPNGSAAEVVNCRCTSNTRARWALGEEELQTLKDRAEYFGLDKTKNFEEYKQKYLTAAEESEKQFGVRYGDNAIDVDFGYINSKSFENKFSRITNNPKANNGVYDISKTMLKHCDGTEHEDMYLLSMDGDVISKVNDSVSRFGINYSDEFKKALADVARNNTPVIAVHNHPHGTPPSIDDFRKAFENKYAIGIVVGHNGQVYSYINRDSEISAKLADQIADDIEFLYRMGWDIDRASQVVYDEHGLKYTILEGVD